MAEKPNKTEQGRQKRAAEKSARAAATQGRRDSAAAAQGRSEQRKGRNVDEGSAGRDASFAAREANAGLTPAGNKTMSSGRGGSGPSFAEREAANGLTNTTSGRVASKATNPDFPPVGTPAGNDEFAVTSNISGGGGGGGGVDGLGGSTPLYQDGAYTGPFAIKINGSYSTDGEGVISQSSSFNIGVEDGTGTWPTKTAQSFSGVSIPASANDEFYRVYGQITADYSTGSDVLDTWTDPSIQAVTATSGTTVGSNTRYINNGTNYTFYFLIGTVGITVQPSGGYRISVNQIQIGNYTYGDAQGVSSDTNGNDTRDGVRSLTICINGEPYKADFELTNIRPVT